jgi:hypothetical protein
MSKQLALFIIAMIALTAVAIMLAAQSFHRGQLMLFIVMIFVALIFWKRAQKGL